MKNILPLFLLLIIYTHSSFAQKIEIPTEHQKVVHLFINGVKNHSEKDILKAMDKKYRKEQIKFLKGNKKQFIDELFGGEDLTTHEYENQSLNTIEDIELYSIIKDKEGNYKYIFKSLSADSEILFTLFLTKRGLKYGFEGARG